MSYDINISWADGPWNDCDDTLDIAKLIKLFNAYPPFPPRGITWQNERWSELTEFRALMVYLENHAPARNSDGTFDYGAGHAAVCQLCVSLSKDDDLGGCMELAAYLARGLGAHAWDLQTEVDLAEEPGC